jgi:hypothetical protein
MRPMPLSGERSANRPERLEIETKQDDAVFTQTASGRLEASEQKLASASHRMDEIAKLAALGNLRIRDMIDQGRRY